MSKEIWRKRKSAKESNRFRKLFMQVLTQRCLQLLLTPKHFEKSNTFWLLYKNKQIKQIFWSLPRQWKLLKTTDQFWHSRLKSFPNPSSRYCRGNGRKEGSKNKILYSKIQSWTTYTSEENRPENLGNSHSSGCPTSDSGVWNDSARVSSGTLM